MASFYEWSTDKKKKDDQNNSITVSGKTFNEYIQEKNAPKASPTRYYDPLTEAAREDAAYGIARYQAEQDAKRYSDPLTNMAREMAAEAVARKQYMDSIVDPATGKMTGVNRVAPGTAGGGGRGINTVSDLDPATATPGDYMAAIAREQQKAYADMVTPGNTALDTQREKTNKAFRTANAFLPLENQPPEAWDTYFDLYDTAVEEDKKLKELGGTAARELPVTLPKSLAAGTLGAVRGLVNEAGYLTQAMAKGYVAGGADKLRGLGYDEQAKAYEDDLKSMNEAGLQNWASFGTNYINDVNAKAAGYGKVGQTLSNVAQGVGGMVPSILSNLVVPGSGLPVMFIQASGNATEEAKAAGASDGAALLYGAAVGGVEVLTEKMFGGIPGLGIGALDDAVENAIKRSVGNEASQKALLFLIDALGEGVEEFTSEFGDYFLNKWLVKNEDRTIGQVGKDALYSFLVGALTSMAMQAPVQVAQMAKTTEGRKQLAKMVADQVEQQTETEETAPAAAPAMPEINLPGQEVRDVNRDLVRSIESDPEQLKLYGIDTKGKTGSQVRAEIRAALEGQNAERVNANRGIVREFADGEYAEGRVSENGANILNSYYTGTQNPTDYVRGMINAYNAGVNGTSINEANVQALTDTQRQAAYLAGQAAGRQAAKQAPNIEKVRSFTEAETEAGRMSEDGAKMILDYYDGSQNADDYIEAATTAYNAGLEGKPIQSATNPALTQTQRDAAYMAGRAAARQGQTEPAQATVPEPAAAKAAPPTVDTTPQQKPAEAQKMPAQRAKNPGLNMKSVQDSGAKLTRGEMRVLDAVGRMLGAEIQMVNAITDDAGKKSGGQGKYRNGVIQISKNSSDPYLTVAVHEVVHRIRDLSPEAYGSLLRVVENNLGSDMKRSEILRSLGYEEGTDLTEEVVADAFGIMSGDEAFLRQFVQDDRNAARKVLDALHDMLVKIQRALSGGQKLDTAQRAEFEKLEKKIGTMDAVLRDALKTAGEAYETNGGKAAPKDVGADFAEAKYSVAPPYRPNSEALQRWVDEMSNEASETYSLFNDVNQIGGDISKRYMLPSEWNEKVRTDKDFAETARRIAERVPENIRKNARINADGTISETAFEKEFRMERSMMQRLVDSLPMETISSTVESNGRKIRISNKAKVNTVGGEAYRRALLDERRQMYKEGRLPTKSIGGLSKDTWGAMGFLATNGKTGASGDFTTLCPQMYYNKGCFYCYRRAALTTGVNNKLVGENVWYTGEVLQLKQEDIDNLNKNGGLRIQSFGDWMEQYSSQLADLLMDAETVGLQIKIITKEPSMIDTIALLRDQGIGKNLYFNLSSDYTIEEQGKINNQTGDGAQPRNPFRPYMKQEDGRTFWKRALTVEEANEYRKKYPWVNTRIVATTVDEFLEGLRSPMVDVVTGYHGNIRQFERVSSATGETLLQVEPLGDAGMPRFAFNPKTGEWTLEYEGKTATHKKLAKAIEDAGLQMQYYIKSCCITGRCATCEGKCGKLARDFNVKNATNADKQSVAYWQKHMESAEDNSLLLSQMEDDQAKALLDAELNRGKYSKSTKELLQIAKAKGNDTTQREYVDYTDDVEKDARIDRALSEVVQSGKTVTLTPDEIGVEKGATDWGTIQKARTYVKNILTKVLGSNSVFFEMPNGTLEAYITKTGKSHYAALVSPETAAMARRIKEITDNARYAFSSKHDIHTKAGKKTRAGDWDFFVAGVNVGKTTIPVLFSVRSVEKDARAQIYGVRIGLEALEAEIEAEANTSHENEHQTKADGHASNYEGFSASANDNVTPDSEKVKAVKHSVSTKELLQQYAEQYGAIKTGEKPAREVTIPKRTTPKTKVSMTVRTVAEAGATSEEFVPTIENLVANHEFDYTPYSDEKAIGNAAQIAERKGWSKALTDWSDAVSKGEVNKTNTALGWALYNNAVNSGDTEEALNILNLIVKHQRNAAQAVQATRILKQLNPETQLYNAEKTVASLNEDLQKKYGDKVPELQIDPDLAERYLRAKDEETRNNAMKDIFRDIGKQMPTTFMDRWTAWRYTAMLGNLRTIGRNIAGNAGFAPVVWTKDAIATAIESAAAAVSGGKMGRTKGNIIGRGDLLKAAWDDYATMQEAAMGQSKYSDKQLAQNEIQDARKIFGNTRSKAWNKTGGAVLEAWRKGTNWAMDRTDVWFNKPQYVLAMAQYCAANKISAEQIRSGKGLDKARAYAITEAQKATYRDTNDFSQMVSSLGKSWLKSENKWKKGIATLGEGVLPFRKTPANILARGIEYSPVGMLKALTYDLAQVSKGNMAASEMIDNLSAGLTGTGLLALGVYLASQGLLKGRGGSDDKKKKFAELQGHQDYALELPNGTSVTLDWLAPEALPMFIGANLYEVATEKNENIKLKDILNAIGNVTEPMLEMSMLQSLNELVNGKSYSTDGEINALTSKLSTAATSYLTQAFPTLLGQIERTGENARMQTYTDKNSFLTSDLQYTLGKISAKVPFFDYNQIPYIDAWGREELTGKFIERGANNFVNPSFVSKVESSEMEKELERLYDATGEGGVFPQRAEKYFNVDKERKDLTAKEYLTYATEKGRTSYVLVGRMTESAAYKAMSDDERVEAIKDCYGYADQTAKTLFGAKIPNTGDYAWVRKAQTGQQEYNISPEMYIEIKLAVSDIESLKDANGNTIDNTKGLQIMEAIYSVPGLNDDQRQYLFSCYKDVGKTIIGWNKALVTQKLDDLRSGRITSVKAETKTKTETKTETNTETKKEEKPKPETADVTGSSAISAARWEPDTETAYVTWSGNGRTYSYEGVTKSAWDEFKSSKSKGSYVNTHWK